MRERLYYLDWLRIGAFGLLILFHCTRFFDFFPWHVKNEEQSEFVTQLFLFTTSWRMPLIFFVSGAGTYFAMRSKREHFVTGRVKRLLIPYAFGILLLIPPQKYLEFLFYGGDTDSYLAFLAIYPERLAGAAHGFSLVWFGELGYHIWYLPYLFVQTLLLLPLFKWLQSRQNYKKPVLLHIYFLFIPVVLINLALRPFYPQYLNWADFVHFLFFFALGFYFVHFRKVLAEEVVKVIRPMLIISVVTSLLTLYFALFTPYMIKWMDNPDISADYLGFLALRSINALSWVWLLLGLSIRYLNINNKRLPRLNDSVLPVYVLHQTFIIIIGYQVVQMELSMLVKFLMILLLSCLLMYVSYAAIKRLKPLRFLFGMKTG